MAHASIDQHPDMLALRASYDRALRSMGRQYRLDVADGGIRCLATVYRRLPATHGCPSNDLIVESPSLSGQCVSARHWTVSTADVTLPVSGPPFFALTVDLRRPPTAGMIWSHVICGVLITLLGLNAVYFGMRVRGSEH
jgi:hypothetical protein